MLRSALCIAVFSHRTVLSVRWQRGARHPQRSAASHSAMQQLSPSQTQAAALAPVGGWR